MLQLKQTVILLKLIHTHAALWKNKSINTWFAITVRSQLSMDTLTEGAQNKRRRKC